MLFQGCLVIITVVVNWSTSFLVLVNIGVPTSAVVVDVAADIVVVNIVQWSTEEEECGCRGDSSREAPACGVPLAQPHLPRGPCTL